MPVDTYEFWFCLLQPRRNLSLSVGFRQTRPKGTTLRTLSIRRGLRKQIPMDMFDMYDVLHTMSMYFLKHICLVWLLVVYLYKAC